MPCSYSQRVWLRCSEQGANRCTPLHGLHHQTQGTTFPILTAARTGQPSTAMVLGYLDSCLVEVDRAMASLGRALGGPPFVA